MYERIPDGYHELIEGPKGVEGGVPLETRREQAKAAEEAKKQRAVDIAKSKDEARKQDEERRNRNPYKFDAEPVLDGDGNPDADGHALDLAVHSLMLDPHPALDPLGYQQAQRAHRQAQKAEALAELNEDAEARGDAEVESEYAKWLRDSMKVPELEDEEAHEQDDWDEE